MLRSAATQTIPQLRTQLTQAARQAAQRALARSGLEHVPRPLLVASTVVITAWVAAVLIAASTIAGASDDEFARLTELSGVQIARLDASVSTLERELATVAAERDELAVRLAQVEVLLAVSGVAPAITPAITPDIAPAIAPGGAPPAASDAGNRSSSAAPTQPTGAVLAAAAAPVPVATPPAARAPRFQAGSPVNTLGQDLYNCNAFTSQQQAQQVLLASGPGDPNRIDTDRDGIACEALIR